MIFINICGISRQSLRNIRFKLPFASKAPAPAAALEEPVDAGLPCLPTWSSVHGIPRSAAEFPEWRHGIVVLHFLERLEELSFIMNGM